MRGIFEGAVYSEGANYSRKYGIYMCDLSRGEPIMLKNLPIMLCRSARKGTYYAQHLCLLCLIFFSYAHQNIHNNSNVCND